MVRNFRLPSAWPPPADPSQARMLAEKLAAGSPGGRRLTGDPAAARMIAAIGGNSPYLADLAARETRTLRRFALSGGDAALAWVMARLAQADHNAPREDIARKLREAKRQAALVIALADIGGGWPLAKITAALSDLAERCLDLAVAHLLAAAMAQGRLSLPDPARPCRGSGFVVLGMGKLGARELNYSSDIDLILLYDPDLHPGRDRGGLAALFTRIARDLVTLFERRDQDGYVFRTDLRLRPDPAATQPAVSMPGAISYYESLGQNWERAAMIKARSVAGDIPAGQRFLDQIKPFVWRRHLDFAAINDIAMMKRRIDLHHRTALTRADDPVSRLLGHDVKLGEGGIREIEFMVQTLQLVWGGRDPGVRGRETLLMLATLADRGHIERGLAEQLAESYEFLRKTEHRIQMIQDRQTHSLPGTAEGIAALAEFLGFNGSIAFAGEMLRHLERVRQGHRAMFETAALAGSAESIVIPAGAESDDETVILLTGLGYREPARIVSAIAGWRAGHVRALRSERARHLLNLLLPSLLRALARQAEPDVAFARFDRLLAGLPAGVQILSLFQRNSWLVGRLATVLGAAPALAEHLARAPAAIEGLLAPEEIDPDPGARLREQAADAAGWEDHVAIVRRFVRGEEFRLALARIEGRIGVDRAGAARTALADAAMAVLLEAVTAEHVRRFGMVGGGGFGVVALGKAGAREMLAGSDLDLMLVYDYDPASEASDGPKRLAPPAYYARLAHGFVAAMGTPGIEGPLYAIDMRLRPSGNKGPVAVSLPAFRRYHQRESWTWERMALTRARVVTGSPAVVAKMRDALTEVLTTPFDPVRQRANAVLMRARLARERPAAGIWDVKYRVGGLIEVEFIAQTLQLIHGPAEPGVLAANTCEALERLASFGRITAEDAELLMRADRAWRTTQGLLRLMVAGRPTGDLPPSAKAALMRDLAPDVERFINFMGERVREAFIRLIGDPEENLLWK